MLNLTEDPAELNDLSKLQPDKVKELVAFWDKSRMNNGVLDISLAVARRLTLNTNFILEMSKNYLRY